MPKERKRLPSTGSQWLALGTELTGEPCLSFLCQRAWVRRAGQLAGTLETVQRKRLYQQGAEKPGQVMPDYFVTSF